METWSRCGAGRLTLAWLAACVVSCTGQSQRPLSRAGEPAPPLPPCASAKASPALARPAGFPARFPLPPGTVITAREARSGGRLILHTVAPLEVRAVALFFERELPAAGFRPGEGESESGEAEANYAGNGARGRWRATEIPGCSGAVALDVVAGPEGP